MKRYALILTAVVLSLTLVADGSFAQRGGRGGGAGRAGGGASVNRSPSMSRPSAPSASRPSAPSTRPSTPSRPSAGQPSTRPSTPSRPSAGQPSTRPSTPSRPSAGQPSTRPSTPSRPSAGQPSTRPGAGAGTRPSTPSAGTRPSIDRDKIQSGVGARPGQQPSMPDWFKPGASQLPSTRPAPPTASQLPARPGSGEGAERPGVPGAKPPGSQTTWNQASRSHAANRPRHEAAGCRAARQERARQASGRLRVRPHIVRQLAILRVHGIPGIPATRVIAQVIGGVGPQPRPSPVGSSTVGPIRSTTVTDRVAMSTTRTMWST